MSHQQRRASHWRHLLQALSGAVSALGLYSSEVGDVGTTTLEARFTNNVTATDYKAGITIKVNSVSQTINTGTRQADHRYVFFVIDTAADVNDAITFEYDDDLGDYQDDAGNPVGDITATNVTNYIGSHLYFDTADDSVWIGAI